MANGVFSTGRYGGATLAASMHTWSVVKGGGDKTALRENACVIIIKS